MSKVDRAQSANIVRAFNPSLHGARGFFSLLIVVFHVVNSRLPTFQFLSHGIGLFALRSSEHGVELFFGVSGIVIVGALSRAKAPWVFAVERATRIYPVLWASIIVILILAGVSGFEGRHIPRFPVILSNLLALPPVIPGPLLHPAAWSLSYELCFYFFCALCWVLRQRIGWWAWLLVVPAAAWLVDSHVRAILMPIGMVVAVVLARRPSWSQRVVLPGICLAVFLICWEIECEYNGSNLMAADGLSLLRGFQAIYVFTALLAAALTFVGVLGGQGPFCSILRGRLMQFFGTISYSLYLWHPILMSVIKHFMYSVGLPGRLGPYSQLVFLVLSVPPSIMVAWISQLVLEKRVTLWLRQLLEPERRLKHAARAPQTAS